MGPVCDKYRAAGVQLNRTKTGNRCFAQHRFRRATGDFKRHEQEIVVAIMRAAGEISHYELVSVRGRFDDSS